MMLFDDWFALYRIVVVGVLAYLTLIVCLRISGKRTLSKWNAFDFVITVALGSTLATVLLSADVSVSEGAVAFALLIGLQYVITWVSVRVPMLEGLIKSEPTVLFSAGEYRYSALKAQRVSPAEVRAAVRGQGKVDMSKIAVVVLETDGSFSVISEDAMTAQLNPAQSALADVSDRPHERKPTEESASERALEKRS